MDPREQVGWPFAGAREDAMGIVHSNWTCNAWCVSAVVVSATVPHIPTGWLAMLRKGFLHSDVSIGNTLMLDPPVTMKPFETQPIEELMTHLPLQHEHELGEYANLLGDTIKKMGFSDKCHGLIIDGDMAAKLEGYFTLHDAGEVSVSICLIALGNPTDDIHTGDIRVHVQKAGEHSGGPGTISTLAYRRYRILLLHGSMGGGLQ